MVSELDIQNIIEIIDKRLSNEQYFAKESITIKAEELPKLPKINYLINLINYAVFAHIIFLKFNKDSLYLYESHVKKTNDIQSAGKLILVDEDDVYDEAGSRSPMLLV